MKILENLIDKVGTILLITLGVFALLSLMLCVQSFILVGASRV